MPCEVCDVQWFSGLEGLTLNSTDFSKSFAFENLEGKPSQFTISIEVRLRGILGHL